VNDVGVDRRAGVAVLRLTVGRCPPSAVEVAVGVVSRAMKTRQDAVAAVEAADLGPARGQVDVVAAPARGVAGARRAAAADADAEGTRASRQRAASLALTRRC